MLLVELVYNGGYSQLFPQLHQYRQLSLVARSTPIEVLYYRTLTRTKNY